MQQHTAEN